MRCIPAILAVGLLATPAAAQVGPPRELSLEHRMLLRCSAAFALVAERQERREPRALAFPPLRERGREFFVRAMAKLMDEARLDRARVTEALTREAVAMRVGSAADDVMPACLAALDASER